MLPLSFLTQKAERLEGSNKVDAPLGNLACCFPVGMEDSFWVIGQQQSLLQLPEKTCFQVLFGRLESQET